MAFMVQFSQYFRLRRALDNEGLVFFNSILFDLVRQKLLLNPWQVVLDLSAKADTAKDEKEE